MKQDAAARHAEEDKLAAAGKIDAEAEEEAKLAAGESGERILTDAQVDASQRAPEGPPSESEQPPQQPSVHGEDIA